MSFINRKSRSLMEFQKKLFNSRFFTISVLLHFILVLAFGGTVLFNKHADPPDFTADGDGDQFATDSTSEEPPAPTAPTEAVPTMTVPTPQSASNSIEAITTNAAAETAFVMPKMVVPVVTPTTDLQTTTNAMAAPTMNNVGGLTTAQVKAIGEFTGGWAKKGSGGGPGSNPRNREFEFTAYLAKYGDPNDRSRGGDWASTNWIKDGKIYGGSLPNLLYLMNKLSRDKIKSSPNAVPLDLSSQDIFTVKPPFIFFTGHRDFVLTDTEVANLQRYVTLGGCIWGDSSLPGRRSRFDIAFRREMRRVIPDKDKDWEQLPPNHPLFANTRNMYYPEIKQPPPGINYYAEPVYALKFGGEVAVIYTANDYGDMWQIGLDAKAQIDLSRDEFHRMVATNESMWVRREVYYRNIDVDSVFNAYKFGTNLVIHLLTRWEDKVRAVQVGL